MNLKLCLGNYRKKLLIRLKNLHGSPYSIAAGFACGVAVSFTPFIGFHLVLAAITAWILRGNIIASAIGTLIGNPWTFPFIWVAVLSTGRFFLGFDNLNTNVDFLQTFDSVMRSLFTFNFSSFGRDVWPIFYPMLVGCIPYYIIAWFLAYFPIKQMLVTIEKRKQKI